MILVYIGILLLILIVILCLTRREYVEYSLGLDASALLVTTSVFLIATCFIVGLFSWSSTLPCAYSIPNGMSIRCVHLYDNSGKYNSTINNVDNYIERTKTIVTKDGTTVTWKYQVIVECEVPRPMTNNRGSYNSQ